MEPPRTCLVLAAHPDDEVLGCGGTIAKLTRRGDMAIIAILGEGVTSRARQRDEADPVEIEALHERSRVVADLLGAEDVFLYSLPDNRFDTVPLLDIVKIIEELVQRLKPVAVYTQHGGDLNIDHAILYRATLTATRPQAGHPVLDVYAYEVASSTEWAFQQFEPHFAPNIFEDIGATVDTKIRAMQVYESEARTFPHPRSPEAIRAAAVRWGSVAGLPAAEPFQLVRSIRPVDRRS